MMAIIALISDFIDLAIKGDRIGSSGCCAGYSAGSQSAF